MSYTLWCNNIDSCLICTFIIVGNTCTVLFDFHLHSFKSNFNFPTIEYILSSTLCIVSFLQLKGIAKDLLDGICRVNPDVIKFQGLQPKQISGVIIHCVTVFYQREDIGFLKPCAELLKRLQSLKVNFSNYIASINF